MMQRFEDVMKEMAKQFNHEKRKILSDYLRRTSSPATFSPGWNPTKGRIPVKYTRILPFVCPIKVYMGSVTPARMVMGKIYKRKGDGMGVSVVSEIFEPLPTPL